MTEEVQIPAAFHEGFVTKREDELVSSVSHHWENEIFTFITACCKENSLESCTNSHLRKAEE